MVICRMSTRSGSDSETGVIVTHPNRDKPVVQATRATVILLLLVSAALVLIITIGGAQASKARVRWRCSLVFVVLYLVLAFYAARWKRGSLPVSAALAVLLATFALVGRAVLVQSRQSRLRQPERSNAGLLGVLTLLVLPVQILLIAFAMRGFSQGWNVELEPRDP